MAIRNLTYTGTVAVSGTNVFCVIPTGSHDCQVLGMQITSAGSTALDAFEINVRCGKSAVWTPLAITEGAFTTVVYPVVKHYTSSGTAPTTLDAAATSLVIIVVQGIHEVQIKASANTTAVPLTINCTLS